MSYLGVPPFGQTVRTTTELTATAAQTTFTPAGGYLPGYIDVFMNGVLLDSSDYTATNGSTVVLTAAAALDDEIKTIAYWPVSMVDTYRKSETDTLLAGKIGTGSGTVVQSNLASGVAGTGPAFRAYMSAAQTISATTFTKLNFNAESFDTNSNYDTSLYRFTPTVAGYYQVTANTYFSATAQLYIYKNGTANITGPFGTFTGHSVSGLVYMNGSTDYLEIYYFGTAGLTTSNNDEISNQFSGAMVRAA